MGKLPSFCDDFFQLYCCRNIEQWHSHLHHFFNIEVENTEAVYNPWFSTHSTHSTRPLYHVGTFGLLFPEILFVVLFLSQQSLLACLQVWTILPCRSCDSQRISNPCFFGRQRDSLIHGSLVVYPLVLKFLLVFRSLFWLIVLTCSWRFTRNMPKAELFT